MFNYLIYFFLFFLFYVIFVYVGNGIKVRSVSCFNAASTVTGPFDSTSISSVPVDDSKCVAAGTKPATAEVKENKKQQFIKILE
jgi:hypothetical protein